MVNRSKKGIHTLFPGGIAFHATSIKNAENIQKTGLRMVGGRGTDRANHTLLPMASELKEMSSKEIIERTIGSILLAHSYCTTTPHLGSRHSSHLPAIVIFSSERKKDLEFSLGHYAEEHQTIEPPSKKKYRSFGRAEAHIPPEMVKKVVSITPKEMEDFLKKSTKPSGILDPFILSKLVKLRLIRKVFTELGKIADKKK